MISPTMFSSIIDKQKTWGLILKEDNKTMTIYFNNNLKKCIETYNYFLQNNISLRDLSKSN